MFFINLKYKSKHTRINFPGYFGINPINPRDYDYTTDIAGNIQETKGCNHTSDYTEILEITGNNQNTILLDMCFDTIQSDGHLRPYQKPLTFDHINRACQSDVLIIPFDFTISSIPTNRIYPTCYLYFFQDMLHSNLDPRSVTTNDNQPLTIDDIKDISSIDHIQMVSLNEASWHMTIYHSLIYGSDIYKQNIKNKHREAMAINDYSSMTNIKKMHKNYAFSLKCKYVYVRNIVYVYVQNLSFGFKGTIVQRGVPGIRPREYI